MTPEQLPETAAGELLTLQRAAFLAEARAHHDLDLPPLLETLEQVRAVFADPAVTVWGLRDGSRIVAAVRLRVHGDAAQIGRLAVAPDRQCEGLGTALLLAAEAAAPAAVRTFRLTTGEFSAGPLRLYARNGYRETHRTPEGVHELVHLEKVRVRARS
ncbi:GNAT superfamily N-acetyltransferase [Amycolatopsis jiangsuensis]|uniref:GNAT superfamily N-acetyltransferase n=1 Tax=Amycolatopsis jiangsuensis TaxID=1181879 RepID=A0A840J3R3_9PSEU|nr:GNAT superfamily N-acetyltransferase [Amycolatopsis jiangsuensis]